MKGLIKRLLGIAPPPQLANKHLWSIGILAGPSPDALMADPGIRNPVFTRDQVTDISAGFVADPFLLPVNGVWHMFMEVYNRRNKRGEIALATSTDLANWQYRQVVLTEPFHISYPFVFEWQGAYYMVPETHKTRTIRLYRASEFPLKWELVHTLMSGQRFADTTLFRHDNRWWLFTETNPDMKHDTLRLFYADDLMGLWTEHPASPVVAGNPHIARPGGSVAMTAQGPMRFAQDCSPKYGLSVQAFRITTLTTTAYAEQAVVGNPVYAGSGGQAWNAHGMHHVNAHDLGGGRWMAGVDGWQGATASDIAGTG